MGSYRTADIRNVALVGHAGSGKTSLTEAILVKAGAVHSVGLVEKGTTASDFTDEEKHHGHSLYNSILHTDYKGKHINLIDTPGYPDFMGQTLCALPAVETVAIVVNAAAGVESMTRRMMERAEKRNLCRMIVVNKIDSENVDLAALLEGIKEAFGSQCLPINLPSNGGKSVVDCFYQQPPARAIFGLGRGCAHGDRGPGRRGRRKADGGRTWSRARSSPSSCTPRSRRALREGHLVPILLYRRPLPRTTDADNAGRRRRAAETCW